MMTDDELDLRLRRWFAEGPGGLSQSALDGVAAGISARPQRGAVRPGIGRPRAGWLVAAAVIVAALVAARLLTMPDVAQPDDRPTPSPTAAASPRVAVQDAGLLGGRWSTLDPAPGLPTGRWELSLGHWAVVTKPSFDGSDATRTWALWLRPVTILGDEIDIAAPVGATCVGQAATYRWVVAGDDTLRLEPVVDACQERRDALAGRAWTRAWAGQFEAGRTYWTNGAPVSVGLTAPAGPILEGSSEPEWFTHNAIEAGSGRLVMVSVVRSTYVTPCDVRMSYQPFEGNAEDLADWLAGIPEVNVEARETVEVDGHPAIRLRFSIDAAASSTCTNGEVAFWSDPGASDIRTSGGARQGHRSDAGTTEEMTILDVGDEVVAISAQAQTPVFEAWLEAVRPMLDAVQIGG